MLLEACPTLPIVIGDAALGSLLVDHWPYVSDVGMRPVGELQLVGVEAEHRQLRVHIGA